jgi:hypothetical protein
MRQPIDTAPKDGKDIWVEDATGAIDVARWSSQVSNWVWKNGHPFNTAPSHWYPLNGELFQEDERSSSLFASGRAGRRLAVSLSAVILGAVALMGAFDQFGEHAISEKTGGGRTVGLNLRPEAATGWQTPVQPETSAVLMQDTDASRQAPSAATTQPRSALEEDASHSHAVAGELTAAASELRRSLDQERERSAALAAELAKARGDLETSLALSNKFQNDAVQRWEAAEITAEELRRSLQQEQAHSAALADELSGSRNVESRKTDDEAAQQARDREIAELRQSLQQEREKTAALTREVGAARQAMTASAEQQRRALEEAQMRAAALASELAGTSSQIETQASQSEKAAQEAAQQKQAAEGTIAELRQSLQQEREKAAALLKEAETARAATASGDQQRRALDEAKARLAALTDELTRTRREAEARDAQSRKANDAAAQQRQAAEREIAELRRSLQQERSRTEATARDLASAPRDERVTGGRAMEGPMIPVTRSVAAAVSDVPTAASQDKAEAARLITRAGALLGQGNIGAARIVLERAAENGNAQASFMLAETYDPLVLSAWGTYGTRGDAAKARELYAKAHSGGVREAKDRLDALPR